MYKYTWYCLNTICNYHLLKSLFEHKPHNCQWLSVDCCCLGILSDQLHTHYATSLCNITAYRMTICLQRSMRVQTTFQEIIELLWFWTKYYIYMMKMDLIRTWQLQFSFITSMSCKLKLKCTSKLYNLLKFYISTFSGIRGHCYSKILKELSFWFWFMFLHFFLDKADHSHTLKSLHSWII